MLSTFSLEHGDILFMDCSINRISLFPPTPSISHQLQRGALQHLTPLMSSLQCLHDEYVTFLGGGVSCHMTNSYHMSLPYPSLSNVSLQSSI